MSGLYPTASRDYRRGDLVMLPSGSVARIMGFTLDGRLELAYLGAGNRRVLLQKLVVLRPGLVKPWWKGIDNQPESAA
jgi:hypothetical protein